jgi:hypothetical protein
MILHCGRVSTLRSRRRPAPGATVARTAGMPGGWVHPVKENLCMAIRLAASACSPFCCLPAMMLAFLCPGAWADTVQMASVACDGDRGTFSVTYHREHDDFFSQPNLPLACRVRGNQYEVTGARGPFRESGMCGGQPPVRIQVSRNGKPLIVRVVFGDNCFTGAAMVSAKITESGQHITGAYVCAVDGLESKPTCRQLAGAGTGSGDIGIDQLAIERLVEAGDR